MQVENLLQVTAVARNHCVRAVRADVVNARTPALVADTKPRCPGSQADVVASLGDFADVADDLPAGSNRYSFSSSWNSSSRYTQAGSE
jgi:hypothetical protein